MSSLWSKSNIAISNSIGTTAQASEFDGPVTAYTYFNSDGSISYYDPSISYGSTNWATPTTAGVGSSYWIKVTRTNGITPSHMTSGTIYALSGSPYMFITAVYHGQIRIASGTIDIYSDSGGTTRVGGGTYSMNAEWYY
jgi:hypothetical protein